MKKHKVIINTDIGIDDATALILTMFDERLDIKLYTTVKGNVGVDIATNNMLHLLEKYGKNFPVARGCEVGIKRLTPGAEWLHGEFGLGKTYIAPKAKKKPIKLPASEAMYKLIKENPHEITIIECAPHTNTARMLLDHPDAAPLVKQIICEGFSAYGTPGLAPHISFNVRTDPEAFKIVLDSGIPLVIIPSEIGRRVTYLTEKQVEELGKLNDTGRFLEEIYQDYWERGFDDKRIATNDSLAYIYLVEPEMFKYEMVDVAVNLQDDAPGKTWATISAHGQVKLITECNRYKFIKSLLSKIKKLDKFKFYD